MACPLLDNWAEEKGLDNWTIASSIDIAVSLLVPSPYQSPVENIEQAFLKFAGDRSRTFPDDVALFYDPSLVFALDGLNALDYPGLKMLGSLTVNTSTTEDDVHNTYLQPLKFLSLNGHGNPQVVQVTPGTSTMPSAYFDTEDIGKIDVPFIAVSGCNTFCWFSKSGESVPYYDPGWPFFGGLVLGSGNMHALVTGIPDQQTVELVKHNGIWEEVILDEPYSNLTGNEERMAITNFYAYSVPKLAKGKSLAQAIYGATFFNDNVVVYGDITFHY
jgi:hypothetical protein